MFVANISVDAMVSIALVFLGLLIIWVTLDLFFCYEMDFKLDCERVTRYLQANSVTRDNYVEFTSLFLNMSNSIRRAWKSYELCVNGMPSDYLKQFECLDMQVGAREGFKKIINATIYVVFGFLCVCGLAVNNAFTEVISAKILLDSLAVPLVALLVYKGVYFLYLGIRSLIFRDAVDSFNDMVDLLDEKVSLAEIFEGYEDAVAMCSNVYSNETVNKIKKEENRETLRKIKQEEYARRREEQERAREAKVMAIVQERERAEIERKMQMIEKIKSEMPEEMQKQEAINKKQNEYNANVVGKLALENELREGKRGRGRPKKIVPEPEYKEEKRGRGRPKKIVAEPVVQTPKRGRGRPRKNAIEKTTDAELVFEPRATILSEEYKEGQINSQSEFIDAMNELERLLDANGVTTISPSELEENNARIDELVAKMMEYKKMNEEA